MLYLYGCLEAPGCPILTPDMRYQYLVLIHTSERVLLRLDNKLVHKEGGWIIPNPAAQFWIC